MIGRIQYWSCRGLLVSAVSVMSGCGGAIQVPLRNLDGGISGDGSLGGPGSFPLPTGSLLVLVRSVSGTFYHSYGYSPDYSPDYLQSYRALRDRVWSDFVTSPGEDFALGIAGQLVFAGASGSNGEGWSWNIDYQGHESEFRYSLHTKQRYSQASIGITITPALSPMDGELAPFNLQIHTPGRGFLFELLVDETYPFFDVRQYDFTEAQFDAFPLGTDVPLFVTTDGLRTVNPLPTEPTSDDIAISAACGFAITYIELKR